MSLSAPPNQHQPPPLPQPAAPLTFKARLIREYRHWADLPAPRFVGLLLPICLLVFIAPLLPFLAYTLWLWAASSWAWRDRWASVGEASRRGGTFVGLVLLYAVLSNAQIWILPQLTATLQAFWRTHLPGELSLMPLLESSLLARTLVLLPLAPALARYFERVDPRTRVQHPRILLPTDVAEPKTETKTETTAPPTAKKAAPRANANAATPQRKRKRPPAQQITIDSFLTTDQVQATSAPPSRQTTLSTETHPSTSKSIDWNDVAE